VVSRLRLALLASLLTLVFAPAANAGLLPGSCPGTTEHPFLPWLDITPYTLAPDGGFEGGAQGWALAGGAKVVSGNESFFVHRAGETRSLMLPAGSSATTPPMCMGLVRLVGRFFVRSPEAPVSGVRVQVIYRGLLGVLGIVDGGLTPAVSSWQPSLPVGMIGATLNVPLGTRSVQYRFTPTGSASAQIDDVYVDPWLVR
jgi:hypothetical protein